MSKRRLGATTAQSITVQIAGDAMSVTTSHSTARAGFPMAHYNLGTVGIGNVPMEKSNERTRTKHD